jgi:hypothetical protein
MAGVDALIAPKAFKAKDKEAEVLLIDFDLYVKTIRNFFIATGKDTATDQIQAVGGPDMVDLVEEVGKVILVAIAADAANEVEAVEADTFEQAIEKIRQGIVGKTNQAMSRLKLFQQMGQGTQKFASWHKEVFKQAKRCDWSLYNAEEAARDAIMYQTSDQKLRKRILAQNMSYQDRVSSRRILWQVICLNKKKKQIFQVSTKFNQVLTSFSQVSTKFNQVLTNYSEVFTNFNKVFTNFNQVVNVYNQV